MSVLKALLIVFPLFLLSGCVALAENSPFAISDEPLNIFVPHKYFGLSIIMPVHDGGIDQLRRSSSPKAPGIYYLWPARAYPIELASDEFYEVVNWLKSMIDSSCYDLYVLTHLKGFYYELQKGSVKRREYHIRYSKGDTILVISGWLGKFHCFYMAIPTDKKLNVEQLQRKVKAIFPGYTPADDSSFTKLSDGGDYLLDYIDRKRMVRVRNFNVGEDMRPSDDGLSLIGLPYNVIEITQYIDREVMP